MKKIYYDNKYLKEFSTNIIEDKLVSEQHHVVLEETAFFPGGGGQHCDKGEIEGVKVLEVYEEKGIIYHILEGKPKKMKRVKCIIDWDVRFDGMQQHLAQHVLSGCFFNLFNANTQSFHLGKEACTVDIVGQLTKEQIREAELLANKIIRDNIEVENFVPNWVELKKLNLRRDLPNTDEEIRVVKIGELDINACCGLHPISTLELNIIKIKSAEKHKNATRIEFLAGERALLDYIKRDDFSINLCRELHCGEEDALASINNLNKQIRNLIDEGKKSSSELAEYKVKEIIETSEKFGEYTIVSKINYDMNPKELSNLSSKLVKNDNVIALLATVNEDRVNLIFACSENVAIISMNEVLKDAITLIDGKGGGSNYLAQGGGKNNNNLQGTLDYARNKIVSRGTK